VDEKRVRPLTEGARSTASDDEKEDGGRRRKNEREMPAVLAWLDADRRLVTCLAARAGRRSGYRRTSGLRFRATALLSDLGVVAGDLAKSYQMREVHLRKASAFLSARFLGRTSAPD
jgi:hypothetical protein